MPRTIPFRLSVIAMAFACSAAQAGVITAQGNVDALTHFSQVAAGQNSAGFETGSPVPLDAYAAQGMHIAASGANFGALLPGIVSSGTASEVQVGHTAIDCATYFGAAIGGGGSCANIVAFIGLVATFDVPVTQFGVTLSRNGRQYLTAWADDGSLIGQVSYEPDNAASFVGIDTRGKPIAMLALGNDDVYGGNAYNVGGTTTIWDNAVWTGAAAVPAPATMLLAGLGLLGLGPVRRRHASLKVRAAAALRCGPGALQDPRQAPSPPLSRPPA